MPLFSSVLVDIDALAARHPALTQGFDLATRCGARVKVVDVLPNVPLRARSFVTQDIERELTAHRQQELSAIEPPPGLHVSTAVLRGRPAQALTQEVLANGHDLVVRAHIRDLAEETRPFGAVDMDLLRQCPAPVWLVGPKGGRHPNKILAAINANPDDAEEQKLNTRILDVALALADVEQARLTVLQAWEAFGESALRGRMSDEELAQFRTEARRTASDDLAAFVSAFGTRLGGTVLAIESGPPEAVIPAYVESHKIDLVVMGTVARTGVAGLVMGNTAERVLRRLHGSVLAVKPEGFISPVKVA